MDDLTFEVRRQAAALNGKEGEALSNGLKDLEELLAHGADILPGYSMKQLEEVLKPLRERVKKAKTSQKTFTFKKTETTNVPPSKEIERENELYGNLAASMKQVLSTPVLTSVAAPNILVDESFAGKDVTYGQLINETIIIKVPLSALTLTHLEKCRIYCSEAIASSLVVRNCKDCEIHAQACQVRIHECESVNMFLFTLTDPIIEKSTKMGFGSYSLVQSDPSRSNSDHQADFKDTLKNRYKFVRDFDWLKLAQSPNWHLILEKPASGPDFDTLLSNGLSIA